jgi:hypothetical protein
VLLGRQAHACSSSAVRSAWGALLPGGVSVGTRISLQKAHLLVKVGSIQASSCW